jgi:hypothetical protein
MSEIIHIVTCGNYDGFNTSTSYFHDNSFHYFKDYLNEGTNPMI